MSYVLRARASDSLQAVIYDYAPQIVTDQPELPFEGIAPLTSEERIIAWLRAQEAETIETITATLFLMDGESRRSRAERWFEIRSVQAPYERDEGWPIMGGPEVIWLYEEACHSYADSMYLAALLCAHSACERELAGCLELFEAQLPPRWQIWGLGKLVPEAFRLGLIDETLRDQLYQVSELRKVSSHFKPPLSSGSIIRRAGRFPDEKLSRNEEDASYFGVMRVDALRAIETSTELLRGNQGLFFRIRTAKWRKEG